jgi:hypothetical protein
MAFYLAYYIIVLKSGKSKLSEALPHLSDKESSNREIIYRHLCDMFMEMIKRWAYRQKKWTKDSVTQNIELIKE